MKDFESIELIEKEIEAISTAIQRLKSSRLSERAIIVLIHDSIPSGYGGSKIGRTDIKKVLDAASNLRDFYIKKSKPAKEAVNA